MRKVIMGIIVILAIIWGVVQLVQAQGNIGVAISNKAGLAVGDCMQDNTALNEVDCSSPDAAFKVLEQTQDSSGASCPPIAINIITESKDNSTTYWCIGKA